MFYYRNNFLALVVLTLFFVLAECRIKIGHLQTISHGVKGTVYALNKHTLLIQQFTFLGKLCVGTVLNSVLKIFQ